MMTTTLRTDYMENPLGFDLVRPTLNWITQAPGENKHQTAYQIEVSMDADFAELALDTGKTVSDASVGFRLDMKLKPCTRYYWRVRIWDEKDTQSDVSAPAFFETGRYGAAWTADWIGWDQEFPQLRKGFVVEKPIKSARAYASGLGLYSLFVNGEAVSDERLTPGINAYDQWIQYQTYDLTDKLAVGENAIGCWLGNGYYKGRVNWPSLPHREHLYGDKLGFIAEIHIEYMDGTRAMIPTDTSWKVSKNPYDRAEIYDGEVFDARRLVDSWNSPGFDDSMWDSAVVVNIDKQLLQARKSIPVVVSECRKPEKLIVTPKGEMVLDFGQNFAAQMRIKTDAPEGTRIHVQFGEALDQNGNFYRENMRTALAELVYIADGKQREYLNRFTFYGFRYARVSGLKNVRPEDFSAEVIYSGMERTGRFTCSNEKVNKLVENALWSQKGNFVDVPTDCPQRDERMGWTGDAQVFCPTALMNMDCNAFYRKYLYDLKTEQNKLGYVPVVVPFVIEHSGIWAFPTAGWGDAATLMPWYVYLYTGDKTVLEEQYQSMVDWVDYITEQDKDKKHLYEGFHLGDWLAQDTKDPDNLFGQTPTTLVATAYYAWSAEHVVKAARVLGKEDDARKYEMLAEEIKQAFRDEFVTPGGRVATETQTAYLMALNMDMLTADQKKNAIDRLAERIVADNAKLTTGFLGTPYLCTVLSDVGLDEYAYALLLSEECPSWLYEVKMGATTVWERWNSVREDGTFGPVSMNSLNHYAFGAVVEWLYRYVAGINPLPDAPGYKKALIAPKINDQLGFANASIRTAHGLYKSGWELNADGTVTIEIEIPFNACAEIVLPHAEGAKVLENGKPIEGYTIERGSGTWRYTYAPSGNGIASRIVWPTYPPY